MLAEIIQYIPLSYLSTEYEATTSKISLDKLSLALQKANYVFEQLLNSQEETPGSLTLS